MNGDHDHQRERTDATAGTLDHRDSMPSPDVGIGAGSTHAKTDPSQPTWWRVVHFFGVFVGGIGYLAGSGLFYYPDSAAAVLWGAALYLVGSLGFLVADMQDLCTFARRVPRHVTANIATSVCGSIGYTVGSFGFFPAIAAASPELGAWGFVAGSAFVVVAQMWVLCRIGSGGEGCGHTCSRRRLKGNGDVITQAAVAVNMFAGGWFFLFPSAAALRSTPGTDAYTSVVSLWLLGSVFFTVAAGALWVRHFILHL
jgi:hypothetical protein